VARWAGKLPENDPSSSVTPVKSQQLVFRSGLAASPPQLNHVLTELNVWMASHSLRGFSFFACHDGEVKCFTACLG
jgi:hypothetical protein